MRESERVSERESERDVIVENVGTVLIVFLVDI